MCNDLCLLAILPVLTSCSPGVQSPGRMIEAETGGRSVATGLPSIAGGTAMTRRDRYRVAARPALPWGSRPSWRGTTWTTGQDFVRAFAELDGFRADSALRDVAVTIVGVWADRRRAAKRRALRVRSTSSTRKATIRTDSMVADEMSSQVQQAIARLSRMQREVFTLRVQEGRSYKDIAEILETSEGAARVHYHNAVRAVKEFLDD